MTATHGYATEYLHDGDFREQTTNNKTDGFVSDVQPLNTYNHTSEKE